MLSGSVTVYIDCIKQKFPGHFILVQNESPVLSTSKLRLPRVIIPSKIMAPCTEYGIGTPLLPPSSPLVPNI